MHLEGRIWKDGRHWLAEVPALDYMTQGHTKKHALKMVLDIVKTGIDRPDFQVKMVRAEDTRFVIASPDTNALVAHMLLRLRQKHGLTVREVSRRLGSKSPNAYGVYEQGKSVPTLTKLEQLLRALHESHSLVLKFA